MPAADSRKSFLMLDAFRGCAALWVVLYHGRLEAVVPRFPDVQHNAFYLFSTLGSLGVQLFFVISGYCIANAAAASLRREDHSLSFMWARLRRIYPPYFCALLASAAMGLLAAWLLAHGYLRSSKIADDHLLSHPPMWYIAQLTLTQTPLNQAPLMIVSWTLCFELAFYVIVAIVLQCVRATASPQRWLLPALHSITIISMALLIFAPRWNIFPLWAWPQFGMGVLVFDFISSDRRIKGIWIFALIILIETGFIIAPFDFSYPSWRPSGRNTYALTAVFAILLALVHPLDAQIARLGPMRLLAWIGTFSYSLYLTHIMSTGVVAQAGRSHLTSPGRFWIVLIAEVSVAILAAYPFYYVFERPFLSRKRIVQARATAELAIA